jgi:hypothetical protein
VARVGTHTEFKCGRQAGAFSQSQESCLARCKKSLPLHIVPTKQKITTVPYGVGFNPEFSQKTHNPTSLLTPLKMPGRSSVKSVSLRNLTGS